MPKRRSVKSADDRAADAHVRGRDYLGQPDVDRLLVASKKSRHGVRDHLLILMMFRHGLRVSEAIALRRQDVDLAQSRVWIARLKNGLSVEQPVAGDELRAIKRWLERREDALPVLYLRGISTGDFQEALAAILGKDAPNLSPSVISRLTGEWKQEYDRWQRRDLSARRYVYIWADGVYLQARMEPQAECILVILGATPEGKKELVGFRVGVRESTQSWRELLVDIKARGLAVPPEVAVGDGAMGFWKALDEVFPGTRHQRRWVHKTANVLNKFPKSMQPTVKADLREIWQAETRAVAQTAMDTFAEKYGAKYEKAVTCLTKDKEALLTFYDFPADHWDHLRTGNPIESVFATVRHRTVRTKGALSQKTAKLMVFKLVQAAAKTWRRLKGANQLPLVIEGVTFTDGVAASAAEIRAA